MSQIKAKSLLQYCGFTHFITLSLKQSRAIQNIAGSASLLRGDDVVYQATYEGFIRSLTKRMANKHAWKRRTFSIPNIGSIEGDGNQKRYHLHICVQKPLSVSESDFERHITQTAFGNPWIEKSEYSVNIATLTNKDDAIKAIQYSLKHGLDRVLIA